MRQLWKCAKLWALCSAALMLMSACGGSGGTTNATTSATISGVAAGGAPLYGTVYIKDSKGVEKSATIDLSDNGAFQFDVSGLTPPFKLKAVGQVGNTQVTYCSVATSADVGGTINITPFTDLIVANIAAQLAENYYESSDTSQITSAAINTQIQALAETLAPVLEAVGLSASVDLLRLSFTPDNTGLDKVMDIVKVSVDAENEEVTLTNIIDGSEVSGSLGDTLSGTLNAPTTTQLSDLDQIKSHINTLCAKFAASTPSADDLQAFFDQENFLDDGRNLQQFLADMTDGTTIGMQAGAFSLVPGSDTDLDDGRAEVIFHVILPRQNNSTISVDWRFSKESGAWVALGNQRLVKADIHAIGLKAQSGTQWSGGTGIIFSVSQTAAVDTSDPKYVAYAVITGPGLDSGLTLYNNSQGDNFGKDQGSGSDNGIWFADDSAVTDTFPEGSDTNVWYTVEVYDSNGNQLDTYETTLTYRPYTPTELASAPFATITSPATSADLANFQLNVAQTVAWTLAADSMADFLQVFVNGSVALEKTLLYNQTSATGTITGSSVSSSSIFLSVNDSYGRALVTTVSAP